MRYALKTGKQCLPMGVILNAVKDLKGIFAVGFCCCIAGLRGEIPFQIIRKVIWNDPAIYAGPAGSG